MRISKQRQHKHKDKKIGLTILGTPFHIISKINYGYSIYMIKYCCINNVFFNTITVSSEEKYFIDVDLF